MEQDLPGYITAFKNAPWLTRDSAHYQLHYMEGSLAEREIDQIEKTQEDAYKKITEFLDLPSYPVRKIAYYLYPNSRTKKELMGNEWFAQSVYADFAVHALYTEDHRVIGPHEDMHLLSLPLGLSIGFIQEGLAEYIVGHSWYGESFQEVVKRFRGTASFNLSENLFTTHEAWRETNDEYAQEYYALAALFAAYLIKKYGVEKYLKTYQKLSRESDALVNRKAYEDVLGVTLEVVLDEFRTLINQESVNY